MSDRQDNYTREVLKAETIPTENGGRIPVELISSIEDDEPAPLFSVEVDGVEWFITENVAHASVLFQMMKDHLNEYMHYKSV